MWSFRPNRAFHSRVQLHGHIVISPAYFVSFLSRKASKPPAKEVNSIQLALVFTCAAYADLAGFASAEPMAPPGVAAVGRADVKRIDVGSA
jgi:hypothetical protein